MHTPALSASVSVVVVCLSLFGWPGSCPAKAELSADQRSELETLKSEFTEAPFSANGRQALNRMMRLGEAAQKETLDFLEAQLDAQEEQYVKQLAEYLPQAYLKPLSGLRAEQIYKIQKTRRLWKRYILKPSDRHEFQTNYLKPCMEIKDLLLIDVEGVVDRKIAGQRAVLKELAGYRDACRKKLGLGKDPTEGMKSPTGIDIPHLDRPMTFAERLDYLDASAVLAYTVGPEGARPVLLANARRARIIDFEEADFALFGNEVRMLVGSIVWEIDPLVCACTRDHSTDRRNGKASGHRSTIPGKEGFVHRLRRFGARGRSEGAGGGKNGRDYIWGLSYGGGHTGPLYGVVRNVHGCGRRGDVYTSIYYTKNEIRHPCAATENELFMPPGFTGERIDSEPLRKVYQALRDDQFGKADEHLPDAREGQTDQEVIRRFFKVAIEMEADWASECATAFIKVGDLYQAKQRLEQARDDFAGADRYVSKFEALAGKMERGRSAEVVEAGRAYNAFPSDEPDPASVKQFIGKYLDTVYAKAAAHYLNDVEKRNLFSYFLKQNPNLRKYEYHLP